MPRIALDIIIGDSRWRGVPCLEARLRKAAALIGRNLSPSFPSGTVTVLLTDNAAIRRLNRDFRGLGRPTNVLSFPQFSPRELTKKGKKEQKIHAGDLALGYQYIVSEAKRDHKILINHALHLLIHGILHLFGYDHASGAGAIRMERLEKKIMRGLGLPNPYAPQPREPKAR